MKTKKIIKALKTIGEVCNRIDNCRECIFGINNLCLFNDTPPVDWNIETIQERLKEIEFLDRCALIDKLEEDRVRREAEWIKNKQ